MFALTLVAAVAVAAPSGASGQGFGLNDIGSCAVGRAYAATGAPCRDASVIYWNPGAAATLPGLSIYAGDAGIGVNGGFTADTTLHRYPSNAPIAFPPHLFVNYTGHLGTRAASAGVGVYVPYGLTSQWNSDFPGRFEAQKATLQTFYIQPNFSIEVVPHVLSIGGGPVIGRSSVELDQGLDLSQAPVPLDPGLTFGELGIPLGTEFGEAKITGSATSYGWALGALYRPIPTVQIGARFLSAITFDYSGGSATFKQISTGLVLAANNPLGLPGGTPVDGLLASQFATGGALVSQGAQHEDHAAASGRRRDRIHRDPEPAPRPRCGVRRVGRLSDLAGDLQRSSGARGSQPRPPRGLRKLVGGPVGRRSTSSATRRTA